MIINSDEDKLQRLSDLYKEIRAKLEEMALQEEITEYEAQTIYEMTKNVANHLARDRKNVKERIGEAMGGQILDYPAKRIYDEGKKNERENSIRTAIKLCKKLTSSKEKTVKNIMEQFDLSMESAWTKINLYW